MSSKLFDDLDVLSIRHISNGGYLAICNLRTDHRTKLALKIQPEQNKKLFFNELKNWCYIKLLPYVMPIIDFGLCDGLYYIVMPYYNIDGKKYSLREYINNSPKDTKKNVMLIYRILMILCNIKKHYPNFVHGDIKPENFLFMDSLDQIFITDFGASKVINEQVEQFFIDTTYSYKAPELWLDSSAYTEKSDVYALGIMMSELLLKKHPISSNKSMDPDKWSNFHQIGIRSLEVNDLAPELGSVILKCLQRDPKKRPTIQQLASSISGLLDSQIAEYIRRNFDISGKIFFLADKLILSDDLAIKKLVSIGGVKTAYEIICNKKIPVETYNTHFAFGVYYDEMKNGNKSFEHFLCAMNKAVTKEELTWAINNIALVFKHAGEYEISRTIFHDLLSLTSRNDTNDIILNIALTYSEEGNYRQAISLLNSALKAAPDSYVLWYNLFIIYKHVGDERNAKYAYTRLKMIKNEYASS